MTPIKVLHVVSVDKQNYYLSNLSSYSDSAKICHLFVTLAAENSAFAEDLERQGLKVWSLGTTSRQEYPKAYREIKRIIRESEAEIVHTHLFDPSILGLMAAKKLGRKTVSTRHHSDAIHAIPSLLKRRFYLALENYISSRSDHIIAPSQMVRDILVERERVEDTKVTIIPYGQTTERFDAISEGKVAEVRKELGIGERLAIVTVSRLFHRKGHKHLFEAFSELTRDGLDADLFLIGDGQERQKLESLAGELNIGDRTHFLGWRDDALSIVAACDIMVHPSLEDALSSAVIEAIMMRKPIVATDISGVRDSLGNGKFGVIVKPESSEGMKAGIRKVLNDLNGYRSLADAGRAYIIQYMDPTRVANETSQLYIQLLSSK